VAGFALTHTTPASRRPKDAASIDVDGASSTGYISFLQKVAELINVWRQAGSVMCQYLSDVTHYGETRKQGAQRGRVVLWRTNDDVVDVCCRGHISFVCLFVHGCALQLMGSSM
jgi:uncharacterized protein YunC (DUF1805 family)